MRMFSKLFYELYITVIEFNITARIIYLLSFHLGNTSNIAFGKDAVQSSTVTPASRATDGSTRVDIKIYGGSCSRTKPQKDPWLQVDLAEYYTHK